MEAATAQHRTGLDPWTARRAKVLVVVISALLGLGAGVELSSVSDISPLWSNPKVATAAGEPTMIMHLGAQPYQRWVTTSAAPTPHGEILIDNWSPPECGGLNCMEWKSPAVIHLPVQKRGVFYHELGHAFDAYENPDHDAFAAIDGQPYDPEHFAESYKYCAVNGMQLRFIAYPTTYDKLNAECQLIRATD
jgi:hypothetical protein